MVNGPSKTKNKILLTKKKQIPFKKINPTKKKTQMTYTL